MHRGGCDRPCWSIVPSCIQRSHIHITVVWFRPTRPPIFLKDNPQYLGCCIYGGHQYIHMTGHRPAGKMRRASSSKYFFISLLSHKIQHGGPLARNRVVEKTTSQRGVTSQAFSSMLSPSSALVPH
ncbi:hypothetical protein TNCV_3990821 [Trichonephila clavipes]|uniref:Uncharacterized protein n=1 Tax=Trichonephila clavipes TaxID=2585209 RepID=A0A8X6VSF1_TRICX|nr:hypothetical protein TNCV_3990821 [Trichonephila clavipes]